MCSGVLVHGVLTDQFCVALSNREVIRLHSGSSSGRWCGDLELESPVPARVHAGRRHGLHICLQKLQLHPLGH